MTKARSLDRRLSRIERAVGTDGAQSPFMGEVVWSASEWAAREVDEPRQADRGAGHPFFAGFDVILPDDCAVPGHNRRSDGF